ncbi:uncharacterized protein LOC114470686 isoform X2 [Gouania willdenowi]|uniref:uncharacterized protein LOC114470686 isoform X2 n=1 Tax=Gouania willdenowi TaxID=441366 RepID=UPI00105540D5|nr:uncharacterized protein LOC114470686 isoform X2 [Gouania willdenowi]
MDRHRYFIFNQRSVLVLGVLQVACAGLCAVCGLMDAAFRLNSPLSSTRTPLWGGLVLAFPGVLGLMASQRKQSVLVSAMVGAAILSCVTSVLIAGYSCLTLTYGEEDQEVFIHHHNPQLTFVLHRMVKGANATILLSCIISLLLSSLLVSVGCRSLPLCGCYDTRTGLEMLVPQCDPRDADMMSSALQGDERICYWPSSPADKEPTEEDESPSDLLPYSKLSLHTHTVV